MSFETYKQAYLATKAKMDAQWFPALGKGWEGGCEYNTADGRRCAVGCHLSFYVPPYFNQDTVDELVDKYPELLEKGGDLYIEEAGNRLDNLEFWAKMQWLHDNPYINGAVSQYMGSLGLPNEPFFTIDQHSLAR